MLKYLRNIINIYSIYQILGKLIFMTDLIVFYSRTNNTRNVAEIIKEKTNGELLEVKDEAKREGAVQFVTSALSMIFNRSTKISYDNIDLNNYDTIYIGSPVWTNGPSPAIIEFIKNNDFTGKNVITFATFMANGGPKTTGKMNELVKANGGNILKSFSFAASTKNIKELILDEIK